MGAFQFCQPFLIDTLLQYLQQQPGSQTSHHSIGYGLIGATILIYSGIGVSQAFHWYYQERAMYMVRGALAGAIYKKTTEAKVSATDDKAALTLMSTDVERVIQGFTSMHEFWANTIQVGLACWLLSKQIGAAFIAPLIVVGCCAVCSAVLGKHIPPRQMAWMGKIQRRVGVTAAMIGQMKHLKISGLVAPVENMVQRMRLDELNTGSRFRIVMVLSAVLGFAVFDPVRYKEVVEATMLQADLDTLPQGDETKVGSNGIALSGGQKQRVSIARALYLDSEVFVFDDILSGLDADTEEEIFHRVLSRDGLLRRRKATIVLCTHSIRHLAAADHVIALGTDGRIIEQGTFPELVANRQYAYDLKVKERDHSTASQEIERSSDSNAVPRSGQVPSSSAKVAASSQVENPARMLGDTTVYSHYIARIDALSIGSFIVFGLGWGFFSNFTTIWLKFWSEDASSAHPRHSNAFYVGICALFQALTLISPFSLFLTTFLAMIRSVGAKLHHEALKTVINAPLRFFATTDVGVVTNLFSQDMTLIDGQLPMALVNLALYSFSCVAMAAVIATSSLYLAISYPFLLALLYGIQKFYLRTSRQMRLLDLEAKSPLYTHFLDTMKGIATFRAFGWIPQAIESNNHLVDTSQRPAYLLALIQRWLGLVLQLVVAGLAVIVVSLVTQLRSNSAFTGASLITIMTFSESLSLIVKMYTTLETSIGAVARLKSFGEKVKSESLEGEDVVPPGDWPRRGAIRIDGVSAAYSLDSQPNGADSSACDEKLQQLALADLNLSIAPGEKVAICGRSGSGKSSTILLLLRLLDPLPYCSDKIFIDDTPLHKIDRAVLRQRLIAVPQDPVFLPDGSSFQTNIDPFGASTEEECRAVLETVRLWPFISEQGGLSAKMSADELSQGQRQLFSLARAVLRRRIRSRELAGEVGEEEGAVEAAGGILLLDEVSSSVDQHTDREMQEVILREFESYTIIMVSHRLRMVMEFDTVVVMDQGRIVETGKPRVLADKQGSRFRDLWMVGNKG